MHAHWRAIDLFSMNTIPAYAADMGMAATPKKTVSGALN